jgi:hypothetical protein
VTEELEKASALQAIGTYMCAYSQAAYELGEALKVLFNLKDNTMADAIVAALGDFARQARLARALCRDARNVDGTELSKEQKDQIDGTISDCFKCNDDRVKIAHGHLEPRADGSVKIGYMTVDRGGVKGEDPIIWSLNDWAGKTKELTRLADELRNFQKELKTIKIQIPDLGFLSISNWDEQSPTIQSLRRSKAVEAAVLSGSSGVAGSPPEERKK